MNIKQAIEQFASKFPMLIPDSSRINEAVDMFISQYYETAKNQHRLTRELGIEAVKTIIDYAFSKAKNSLVVGSGGPNNLDSIISLRATNEALKNAVFTSKYLL